MRLAFEALTSAHDRRGFRCGVPAIDRWFQEQAGQEERRNVTRVFVAVDREDIDAGPIGFYTLGMFALALGELPPDIARKLPRYPEVPATLIGRLARAERVKGLGVGELLVADAVKRILLAARAVATFAIVVDAKDERAASFYRILGFVPFPRRPSRLFLPTATAAAALGTR